MSKKDLNELEELEEDLEELQSEGCSCGEDCECGDDCDCDSEMDLAIISTKVDAILELLIDKKIFTEADFEKKYDEICEREEDEEE